MAFNWVMAENSTTRYLAGSTMYFAQGIPYGLMNIAIPAWLASEGVPAGQIASFLAIIILPWAFKLLSGPLMDRYQFLPMGRRRPWVLGAQLGMSLSFFGLVLVENPAEQIGLLMWLGLFINIFTATQDVAVDGMAIDVTPVDEQGRLNGFMIFGKAAGWGITSAVSGVLLVNFGLGFTAVLAAAVQALVLLGFMLTVERRGERRMPWSQGDAKSELRAGNSFSGLIKGLNAVLWTRVSLIIMAIMLLDGFVGGYGHALMPIAAVNLFGFTTPQWLQLVAAMGLMGAGAALFLGPMIDRFGAKRMLILTVSLVAVHAFLLAETQYLWENTSYVRAMLAVWVMLGPVTMVCMIALAMSICASSTSATQFAIYMSLANLGASAGSKTYGVIADSTPYGQAYLLLGATRGVTAALPKGKAQARLICARAVSLRKIGYAGCLIKVGYQALNCYSMNNSIGTSVSRSSTAGLLSVLMCLALLASSASAQAGAKYAFPLSWSFTEDGELHELTFTGQSERAVLFFRVYDIAHYVETTTQSTVSQATVVSDGPSKAIVISFARRLDREQIRDEFNKSLRRNAQPDWLEQAGPTITTFINGIDRDAQPGDQMVFYWLAGGRVIAEFNGEREFGVTDAAFAKLIWSIWFGDEPACDREQLLAGLTLIGGP